MIRRLAHDAVRETVTHHVVAGGSLPALPAADAAVLADTVDTGTYRNGYAEGYEAGESDGLRDAARRMQELEEAARNRLQELADERDRLAALVEGVAGAVQRHNEAMETLAVEVALASLRHAFGEMQGDRPLVQRLCTRIVEEFRVNAMRVVVSAQDRSVLPEHLDGLEVVVEPGLTPGECRVVTGRGYVESSIGQRLKVIYEAMLESLGIERA